MERLGYPPRHRKQQIRDEKPVQQLDLLKVRKKERKYYGSR